MLTAKTKNGKMLCLGNPCKKETLLMLRKKEEFYCPVCGEKVILKLGDRKIFHFSHMKGGSCRDFYENETEYHMEGKLKLYQWLVNQNIPAVLEFYDRDIQQRPDILISYNSQKYALEFQCSTISEEVFKQRTESYQTNGYIPLWILGNKSFKEGSRSITEFQYLFMRHTHHGQLFVPSFSPDESTLHILYSIFPYSTKNALFKKEKIPIQKIKLSTFLDPPLVSTVNCNQWRTVCEQYKLQWSVYPSSQQRQFLNEIYLHHLNLFLLPPEIGLPVPHGLLLPTPSFIWQTYYYIDLLHNKRSGEMISVQQLEQVFRNRVQRKEIVLRNFPQLGKLNPLLAYWEYTCLLERLGVLKRKISQLFQIEHPLILPQTNREQEERTRHFFKQNPQFPKLE